MQKERALLKAQKRVTQRSKSFDPYPRSELLEEPLRMHEPLKIRRKFFRTKSQEYILNFKRAHDKHKLFTSVK